MEDAHLHLYDVFAAGMFDLAVVILPFLLTALTSWAFKRWQLDRFVSRDLTTAALVRGVDLGISRAEQEAHKLRREAGPVDGEAKMRVALDFLKRYLDDNGLPAKTERYLEELIESRLGHPDAPGGVTAAKQGEAQ